MAEAVTITVGDYEYRIGRLPPFKQFHIARRLAPLLAAMSKGAVNAFGEQQSEAPALVVRAESSNEQAEEQAQDSLIKFVQPIAEALASMSDADTEYVLNTCLAAVTRKQGERFAPVMVNARLMFQDIQLADMMQLTVAVVRENLGDFFPAPPGTSKPS